jgi:hypothetical protein
VCPGKCSAREITLWHMAAMTLPHAILRLGDPSSKIGISVREAAPATDCVLAARGKVAEEYLDALLAIADGHATADGRGPSKNAREAAARALWKGLSQDVCSSASREFLWDLCNRLLSVEGGLAKSRTFRAAGAIMASGCLSEPQVHEAAVRASAQMRAEKAGCVHSCMAEALVPALGVLSHQDRELVHKTASELLRGSRLPKPARQSLSKLERLSADPAHRAPKRDRDDASESSSKRLK